MAVDVLVMPLSRYFSGHYITPAMELAWREQGVYAYGRPGDIQEIPPGVPLGGLPAAAHANQLRAALASRFAELAQPLGYPWGERESGPIYFQRLEHDAFLELRWQATVALEKKPRWWNRLLGRKPAACHLAAATVFLPVNFAAPVEISASDDWDEFECGSLPRLIRELSQVSASADVAETTQTLQAAAWMAMEERLPLILDL